MARRTGLGKGLETLIPKGPMPAAPTEGFAMVPLDRINPNPQQPREVFDEERLESLAASIREVGVLQPLVVRRDGEDYVLVAGERRLRASKRAGLTEVPVIIRQVDDDAGSLVQALVENVQREDLSPLEEAAAYRQLMEDFGMTHQQVGEKVSKSRSAVTNALRLLSLPSVVQGYVTRGELSAGHARALAGLSDARYAEHVAKRAVEEGWSVRQVEDAVRLREGAPTNGSAPAPRPAAARPVAIVELEGRLRERLDADVKIDFNRNRGKVVIKFGSVEELERIYRGLS